MVNQPTETSIPIGDWTIGSLKAHHDMMISYERQVSDERDLRYEERWQAQESATRNLKEYTNEYRGSLNDLSARMATKIELTTAITTLSEKIDIQSNLIGELRSRLDVGNPAISTIQNKLAASDGKSLGSDKTLSYLMMLLVGVNIIIGLVIALKGG